jgi:hypothetical protein
MSRKPTPAPASKEPPLNIALIESDVSAADTLRASIIETRKRVSQLAEQLNYEGSLDAGTLENSARECVSRVGGTLFELGAYLLLLREASAHGEFTPALKRLGLEPRSAQRYMQASFRFAGSPSKAQLDYLGRAKILELLALDDEQIEEFCTQGQIGELRLDAVEKMSVKDLRAKVREQQKDAAATEALLKRKDDRINKLMREAEHFALAPADEKLAELQTAATNAATYIALHIRGPLHQAAIKLQAMGDPADQLHFLAGLVAQIQAALVDLRQVHRLPDFSGDAPISEGMRQVREGLKHIHAKNAAAAAIAASVEGSKQ